MKTRNIDEAAYLLSKGHRPKYDKIAQNDAEFYFSNDAKKDAARFLRGEAMVNVTKYLYCRTYLKQSLSKEKVEQSGYAALMGRGYYYIAKDDSVQHALFGKDKCHETRHKGGNFFSYKNDAVAQANKQKHPLYTGDRIGDNSDLKP